MDAAERRVEATIGRIRQVTISRTFALLPAGASHRRRVARKEAEAVARLAGRARLADEARVAAGGLLDVSYSEEYVRHLYMGDQNVATAADRVELSLALQDLALAAAVEDLLPGSTFQELAGDGALLIEQPTGEFDFRAAGIEEGGPVVPGPEISGRLVGRVIAVGIVVVGLYIAAGLWVDTGAWAGALAALLAGVLAFTAAFPPRRARSR